MPLPTRNEHRIKSPSAFVRLIEDRKELNQNELICHLDGAASWHATHGESETARLLQEAVTEIKKLNGVVTGLKEKVALLTPPVPGKKPKAEPASKTKLSDDVDFGGD